MARIWQCMALLLGCIALTDVANATPCDQRLAPLTSSDGYRERASGQRCEGLFISPVAGSPVELVSLTRGKLTYDLAKPTVLSVRLITPLEAGNSPVSVRAMGIPLGLYYRMDAVIEPDRDFSWPMTDVLVKDKLTAEQVGVFAFEARQHGQVAYHPVEVSAPGSKMEADTKINAILRPLTMMDGVRYRILSGDKILTDWTPPPRSGDRFVVGLPAQMSAPGLLELSWTEGGLGIVRSKQFIIVY